MADSLTIYPPAALRARIHLPASKSMSNRALIISALSESDFWPDNISDCDDTRVMVKALAERPEIIDILAAGTAMRFLSAYLSVTPGTHTLTGTERMRRRPIGVLVAALRTLGAQVAYAGEEGFPPLRITGGTLRGGKLALPASVSSQYVSALLMIGPTLAEGLMLTLEGELVSRPYIEMTLAIMRHYGAEAAWQDGRTICVQPVPYRPAAYCIENDWSAASYWYQMVALSQDAEAEVLLPGLFARSTQGDSRIRDFFVSLGVETLFTHEGVLLRKNGQAPVPHLELDLMDQPDLAQTLVATCAMLGVTFRFTGLQSLKIKETDRIHALRVELAKLGFLVEEAEDRILFWRGGRTEPQPVPTIDTYDDHRMAMAMTPCCLRVGPLRINHPEVVSKSYPQFWTDLQQAGFHFPQEQA